MARVHQFAEYGPIRRDERAGGFERAFILRDHVAGAAKNDRVEAFSLLPRCFTVAVA